MATGRIGVTPTLGTRWSKAPSAGTTSLSGLDDSSVSLVYSVGYEQVYRNGVLLSRGNDYTATSGNSITLTDATIAGDIIEVFANELVPLTDAISKGQFTAKGSLLSASAASTPAVLAVGSNDQVLTADSSTSTGLKWATPAAGGKVLQVVQATYSTQTTIATTSMTDTGLTATITPSSASSKVLVLFWHPWRMAGATTSRRISSGKLLRGATSIISPATDVAFAEMNLGAGEFSDTFLGGVWSVAYLDSPATTSATTYKTQAALNSATSMTLYMQTGTSMAAMILAEIGA